MIDDVDIDKILISNKMFFDKMGFKYFAGYKDNENIKSLYTMLLRMCGYAKSFTETKYFFFNKRW